MFLHWCSIFLILLFCTNSLDSSWPIIYVWNCILGVLVVQFNLILAGISPDWGGLVSWRSSLLFIQIFQIFLNSSNILKPVSSADVVGSRRLFKQQVPAGEGGDTVNVLQTHAERGWFLFANISNILHKNVGLTAQKHFWIFHISQIFCRRTKSRVDGSKIFSNISNNLQTNY